MAKNGRLGRYTVIINGDYGYLSKHVKAHSYSEAEEVATEEYKNENPEDKDVGCAGIIRGWHVVWGA
ncbi:hypothetical protein FDG95_gp561 [Pectobacterium phage vB_PcaM_CBB]|uniref:Uncharacterized protein n=1 Tax=Pectobacterium phage vB_PcaM_CBB TaxID=2772511 RepID=A0A1L2CVD0_9CAUD|nr:hypothetical protein FDG95_gp561 [Pectobacterium phage vB_PcaM_CBB]AMM43981.1 hypothetical protein CBB_418 [Pectobacterium phage vB_PcaM_CBB]